MEARVLGDLIARAPGNDPFLIVPEHGVTLTGHVDFLILNDDGEAVAIEELKSVTSKNTHRNVIKNGNFVIENLAQTVAYMVAMRVVKAKLIYTYYEEDGGELHAQDERTFKISIDNFGRIFVDDLPTRYTVQDYLAHRNAAAIAVSTGRVPQRPHAWDAPFGSPCAYCPFSKACDDWDKGVIESDEAFVELSTKCLSKE